jgi:uncharacterized protein
MYEDNYCRDAQIGRLYYYKGENIMFFKFLPKEFDFFEIYSQHADHAVDAAKLLKEIASKGEINEAYISKMQHIEHLGDDSAHTIIDNLNKTFITPFDREDILSLAKELDDIIDMINTIVRRIYVYKLKGVNPNLVEFSLVIEDSVNAVAIAVKGLKNIKDPSPIKKACVEINRLENVGDSMRDKILSDLFENQKDPITLIKLKEIYQDAETILDICEDVAHVVESILVKQA